MCSHSKKPDKKPRGRTKADLTKVVYDVHGGLTQNEAREVVETIIGTMKSSLLEGRQVKIRNFGIFEIKQKLGRRGVDPIHQREIYIPAHQGLKFRPSERLKRKVESPTDES